MLPRLLVLAAALLFSTGGVAIKACTLSGWQIASFRAFIAAATFLILVPEARRGYTRRNAMVAVIYAATLILFVNATKLTTAANAIFLQSTAPLYVLLLGPLLLHEHLRRGDLIITYDVHRRRVYIAERSELVGGRLDQGSIEVPERDAGTGPQQTLGNRAANPLGPAGNDGPPAGQVKLMHGAGSLPRFSSPAGAARLSCDTMTRL